MQGQPCHLCGAVNPDITMVGDHQPPTGLSPIGGAQSLYPSCPDGLCGAGIGSSGQGTVVLKAQQILRNHLVYDPNGPDAYQYLMSILGDHTEG